MVSGVDIVCTRKCRTRSGSNGETPQMIRVTGGTAQQKEIATKVAKWCCEYFHMTPNVLMRLRPYEDCWGYCVEGNTKGTYRILIAHNQSLRDFVATVVHEMIHVKQWEKNRWVGDGESECEKWQYRLTDRLWKKGVI